MSENRDKTFCGVCGIKLTHENSPIGWAYCSEHWKCLDCGESDRRKLCLFTEGVLCDPCHKRRVNERIEDFKGAPKYSDQLICPYCGYVIVDAWEISSDTYECPDCENDFDIERHVSFEYTTRKNDKIKLK